MATPLKYSDVVASGRPSPMQQLSRWFAEAWAGFLDMSTVLWWLAITFFGLGDVLTTSAAVLYGPIVESGPLVSYVLAAHGLGGFLALKLFVFGFAYGFWRTVGEPNNVGVPLALSVLGLGFTTWNLFVLAGSSPL